MPNLDSIRASRRRRFSLGINDPKPVAEVSGVWRTAAQSATIGIFIILLIVALELARPVLLPAVHIMLLLAIVKFDRFEWAVEKATELGADDIVPLAAERSERGLVAASAKRAARWKKILLESAQQSRRLRVPVLHDAAKPQEAFRTANSLGRVLLSERAGAKPMRDVLEPELTGVQKGEPVSLAIAIGPEGGWTDTEFAAAAASGFSEAALGINILRTETAVCAALAAAQYAFGAFRQTASLSNGPPDAHLEEMNSARGKGRAGKP